MRENKNDRRSTILPGSFFDETSPWGKMGGGTVHPGEQSYEDGRKDGASAECDRIRTELETWLIGSVDPRDAGIINGRRITDEIKRICP